jgi:thioredoxin reductase
MTGAGLDFAAPDVDIDRLRGWKNTVTKKLTAGLAGLARRRKVTVINGVGRFSSLNEVEVQADDGSTTVVGFEQVIVAVDSEPATLPFVPHDDPRVIDSTGALDLADLSQRLLVIGGGIIGLEMATVYHELGCRVTVVEVMDQLIPGADPGLVAPLAKRIKSRYENIFLGTKVTSVDPRADGLAVVFDGPSAPSTDIFDKVLVAVGGRPNGNAFGAEKASAMVDGRGFVPVDDRQRTNVPHILAVGDVVGQPMLAHKAVHEGRVAAENAAGSDTAFDHRGSGRSATHSARLIGRVDADRFDAVIGRFVQRLCAATEPVGRRRVLAVDGKTVRGARGSDGPARHLFAVIDQHTRVVLGQINVDGKTNEITAFAPLLDTLASPDLTDVVIGAGCPSRSAPSEHRAGGDPRRARVGCAARRQCGWRAGTRSPPRW